MNQNNIILLEGRVATPLNFKETSTGTLVTFNLAVKRNYRNKQGDFEVDYIPLRKHITNNKFGPLKSELMPKGKLIKVSAELQSSSWTDTTTNETKFGLFVSVNEIQFSETNNSTKAKELDDNMFLAPPEVIN